MDTITAINTLSVLRANKQSELDAINLAVSVLDGTWNGQYNEGEAAKAEVVSLTTERDTLTAEKVNLNAQVVSLQGDLDVANTNIADLQGQVDTLQPVGVVTDPAIVP